MEKVDLRVGDIVQINPDKERWGGFFCIVTEPKTWGCQGYLLHHGGFDAVRIKVTNLAYVRLKFEDIEFCGRAFWMCHEKKEDKEVVACDNILNALCAALICLIHVNVAKDNRPYMLQIIHKILSKNI